MTREEYERRKRRLDEQLRAGVELLESAHRAQVRALDLVWMLQAEEAGVTPLDGPAPAASPKPSPDRPRRKTGPEVAADVGRVFAGLPEAFDRNDVCEALGYEPDRGVLYRAINELLQEGYLRIELDGTGRKPTRYRKTGGPAAPAQA
jgi:hypothetical protein